MCRVVWKVRPIYAYSILMLPDRQPSSPPLSTGRYMDTGKKSWHDIEYELRDENSASLAHTSDVML